MKNHLRIKHVLHVVNVYDGSEEHAAQPFVNAQIQSLRKLGLQVEVFNIRGNESKYNYVKAFFRVRRIIRRKRFDIVHGHYVYSGIVAASQRSVPSIVSFMGSDINGSFRQNGKMQYRGYMDIVLSRLVEYFIDGVIVKTKRMLERLYRPDRAILLPNGVDFDLFRPFDKEKARRRIGIDADPNRKYVLFLGGPSSPVNKGYAISQRTIEILKESRRDIDLLCVSGIPQDQIPYYMNAADVMILPSLIEGSPNVVKEAMACNLPLVSTDVGDVKEIAGGIDSCRIVDRDPHQFACAVQEIVDIGKRTNGREAIEYLRIEMIAKELTNYYRYLAEKKGSLKS